MDTYEKQWEKVDSLLESGLPKSAAKIVAELKKKAIQEAKPIQKTKAELYEIEIARMSFEEADSTNILNAEARIQESPFPLNALWQSVTAELYWRYYEENRYDILYRSRLAEPDPKDWSTWDAQTFVEKASAYYTQSLSQAERLKALPIEPYDPILIKGENTRKLRPTLYDFLAYRALEFFSNDERDLTRPAYAFQIDDPAALAPAAEFAKHSFKTKDTSSLHYHALLTYQGLLRLHAHDKSPDALLDADLSRLLFVYNHSVDPEKKEHYSAALQRIEKAYPQNELSALASYRLVALELEDSKTIRIRNDDDYDDGDLDENEPDSLKVDLRKIKSRLDEIVNRFPSSEGGTAAAQLRQSITAPSLGVMTEQVNLPNEPFRVLLRYRNLDSAWLRIVRLTREQFLQGDDGVDRDGDSLSKYLSQKPVHESTTALPGTEDFDHHRVEFGILALPAGQYAVLISSSKTFSKDHGTISIAKFQTSRLAVVLSPRGFAGLPAGFVLDRKDGQPVKGARIRFISKSWNGKQGKYTTLFHDESNSAADGSFKSSGQSQYYQGFEVEKGDDHFYSEEYVRFYQDRQPKQEREQTLLFTDRNIYRPGQTIYFKGIRLKSSADQKKHNVVAGRSLVFTFYDANYQKVSEQKLTTNEWGSVSGTFIAPESGLMGQMRIETENGSTYFSVEEYKRPSFKLGWDTLKGDYALNEQVSVGGYAQAYAGYPLDGAQVRYRVVRETYFPYNWFSWRWGPPETQEIAEGTSTTDAQGRFAISFKTIPDLKVDAKALPTFYYRITADVTDQNGETHSGTQTLAAGYRSIQISLKLPQQASPWELDSLPIRTENLSGAFVSTPVTIRIVRLKNPEKIFRKRLWATPDQFLLNEVEFHKLFPLDPYKDEDDHRTWSDAEKVLEQNFRTQAFQPFVVPKNTFSKNGWYRVSLVAKDKNGAEIEERKFVQVWDPKSKGNPVSSLVITPITQESEPGKTAVVSVGSGHSQLYVVRIISPQIEKSEYSGHLLSSNNLDWKKELTEEDRGGNFLSFFAVKENRVFVANSSVHVPWSNKDLSIEWGSHRSELEPGSAEKWTLRITGNKKDKVAAEVLAGLYDASLDAFGVHHWEKPLLFPQNYHGLPSTSQPGFGMTYSRTVNEIFLPPVIGYEKSYDRLLIDVDRYLTLADSGPRHMMLSENAIEKTTSAKALKFDANEAPPEGLIGREREHASETEKPSTPEAPLRTNFQETAFFYPDLHTDAEGAVHISFALPDAITEWKFLAFAHSKDMSTGVFEGKITTRKEIMVQPNLPRFLRQGDELFISTKIVNQSAKARDIEVHLEILDVMNGQSLHLPFRLEQTVQKVHLEKGASAPVSWKVHVPDSRYEPVSIRIRATSEGLSDGEEHILPVLSRRILVTESLPLWMNGPGTKDFRFDKLTKSGSDTGLAQHRVVVEYTGNPAWNVVKSLPYLMEYPHDCAEQVFNRFYANELAAHILEQSPNVKDVFKKWEMESLTSSFRSPLNLNQELKSALLEETPWVLDAQRESEQRTNIAQLFGSERLNKEQKRSLHQLKEAMLPEGGWGWFPGARLPNRYITQYIVTGIGRLQHLGIKDPRLDELANRALPYLERMMMEQYESLIRHKANLNEQQIGHSDIQYLYLRSFFPQYKEVKLSAAAQKFYLDQAKKFWPKFNPYLKGMTAIALHRIGDKTQPATILQSLRETAIQKEELGMYWMESGRSWWWWEAPIEAQSLIIECFAEVGKDENSISAMKRWLLKQKQTESWSSTRSTADACYALLLRGGDWLRVNPEIRIKMGDTVVDSKAMNAEAGTGYIKTQFTPSQIKPELGNIQVNVASESKAKDLPSWGAVYWQYFQDQDKVTGAATPLKIDRQLLVERNTAAGPVLEKVTGNLKVGDKVKVRLTLRVDRDMEYVHLKDGRPSCLEPLDVHSGYRWGSAMGYYQSTRDLATHFFIDYLPKGVHVFEYSLFATQAGDFSAGLATIQCMYAPEFNAHSAGVRIVVR